MYYYFDSNDTEATSASSFLRSILRQLLKQSKIPSTLQFGDEQTTPSVNQLLDALLKTTSLVRQHIYIVIDAVDESIDQDLPFIMESLEQMTVDCKSLSLLFTTRHHFVVSDYFESLTPRRVCISEQKENRDIKEYINSRLRVDKRMARWPTELKEEVLQSLDQDAAGM